MANRDQSFFYSVRSLSGTTPETQTDCLDILRSSDFEERSFTQNEIETELDIFCGGHNILVNTDFHVEPRNEQVIETAVYNDITNDSEMKNFFNWSFARNDGRIHSTATPVSNSEIYDISKTWTYGSGIKLQPFDIQTTEDTNTFDGKSTFLEQIVNAPDQTGNFESITPFTMYTVSAYVKKVGSHGDVISLAVDFFEKDVNAEIKTITQFFKGNKGKRTTTTTEQSNVETNDIRKGHFATFDLDQETCVLKSEDCLADIQEEDGVEDFYRISLSFITFTNSLNTHFRFKIFTTSTSRNFFNENPPPGGANFDIDDRHIDSRNANLNWLQNNFPREANRFKSANINKFSKLPILSTTVPLYTLDIVNLGEDANANDGFLIFAPQMNIGPTAQRYGENDLSTVTHDNKFSAGDAVVTRIYEQNDITELKASRELDFITPAVDPKDKLNHCPAICELGSINTINGYAAPKFNGHEFLYVPAFEDSEGGSMINENEKFAMNIAFSSSESDYGQGGYNEVRGKFNQNFSKAQLFGNYNFGSDSSKNITNFQTDLSGTFFFGVDRNKPIFKIYGRERFFSSNSLSTNKTAKWDDSLTLAENLFNDSQLGASADLTIGATGTRLAVLDTLEKCEIARAFVNNANSKHYMGLKQRELTTSYATLYKKFDFWEWIDGQSHDAVYFANPPRVDPGFWDNGQPDNHQNIENRAEIDKDGRWNDLDGKSSKNYLIERLGVDEEINLSEDINFNVSVATIVRDKADHIRSYLNGRLVNTNSNVSEFCSIRNDRDIFLGRAGSGEKFAPTAGREELIFNVSSGHENFGTGFEGFFLELNIAKETATHTFLDTYDNLTGTVTIQEKVDYNINQHFRTNYVGDYSAFTADVDTSNVQESAISKKFGKDLELIYNGDWDGTFKFGWTDNPAWILYDLMTNQRYGIGNQIDDLQDIDVFSLYDIGRHCDAVDENGIFSGVSDLFGGLEPRYSTNIIMNEQENAYNMISNIASSFFGLTYWENGTFNFSLDKIKEPMCVFSNQNVFDGQFNYGDLSKATRFTRVKVNFMDKRDEYKQKAEYVEDLEAIKTYGLIEKEMNALGCTSRGQARRFAKHILYSNLIETETINFTAGQEALLLSPGDVFKVEDELKNFEINYGKIMSKKINPLSVEIEKNINTGSILLGASGGMYVYNNSEQNEVQKIYDMITFDKTETFNSIQHSGTISQDIIDGIARPQVSKLEISSVEENNSTYEIFFAENAGVSQVITDLKIGTPYSIKMSERTDHFYKVIKISEEEKNIYNVQGLQHEPEKFKIIEGDEEFDPDENNFEIGIPKNEINRPLAPASVSFKTGLNSIGKVDLTGQIQTAGSNETKYRVSLYRPNGSYVTREFEKSAESLTDFEFRDIVGFGEHAVEVTSLRNPESSTTLRKTFNYQPKISEIKQVLNIGIVTTSGASFNDYTEISGVKVREEEVFDKNFLFFTNIKDSYNNEIQFSNKTEPKYDVSLNTGSNSILVKENVASDSCILNRSEIESLIATDQRNIDFKFELKNSEHTNVIDTFYLKTKNEPPSIQSAQFLSGIKNQVSLNLELPEDDKDINRFDVFTGISGEFEYFHSQNRLYKTSKEKIIMSKDLFATESGYETGLLNFKVVPVDHIGTGYAYPEFLANLNLE